MTSSQYNNVVQYTLANMTADDSTDSAAVARKIMNNCGVGFPHGDKLEIMLTLLSEDYMGWRSCTRTDAQQMANNGVATIGVSPEMVVVIKPEENSAPANSLISAQSSEYAVTVSELPLAQTYNMAFFNYSADSTTTVPPSTGGSTYLVDKLTGVQTFSLAKDGEKYLSKNFRVREFRCKDGSDQILIDMALVVYMQAIRDWAGSSITINSGYRTVSHNQNIGGASSSQHLYGKAADIICSGKSALELAQRAETLGMHGIEWNSDSNYTHIDTRDGIWHVRRHNGSYITVSSFYNY